MGLKASGHLRFLTSLPSNFSLKNRGQQLKRMYSAIPEAVKQPSLSSSSSGISMLKLSSLIPAASCMSTLLSLTYMGIIVFTVNLR